MLLGIVSYFDTIPSNFTSHTHIFISQTTIYSNYFKFIPNKLLLYERPLLSIPLKIVTLTISQ